MKILYKYEILISLILVFNFQLFVSSVEKPNVILILTDDQGYRDLECFGAKGFKTPNIDKLASEGVKFTDYYAPANLCSPSRAGILTGCYPKRIGLEKFVILPFHKHGINPKELTLAEMFKTVGYKTACVGKWHVGHEAPFLPNQQGFDFYSGIPYSNDMGSEWFLPKNGPAKYEEKYKTLRPIYKKMESFPLPVFKNNHIVGTDPDQTTFTQGFTQDAVSFIKENKENPFFLYFPHPMPHTPLVASKHFKGRTEQGLYGDVIEEIDWSTGQIMDALKEEGIDHKTIVIFTSDNGPWLIQGEYGGSALPLRDGKGSTWEGGMRVPAVIRWPEVIPQGKVCNKIVSGIDFLPTFAEILKIDLKGELKIDGISFLPLLKSPEGAACREELIYHNVHGEPEAIRKGKWKLHIAKKNGWNEKADGPFQTFLVDLTMDKSEINNLAKKYPGVVKELTERLKQIDTEITENVRPAGLVQDK